MANHFRFRSAALALVLAGGACTVQQPDIPSLTGPSGFATSLTLTVTPDTINRDGGSQAAIVVTARDASGMPLANLPVRLDTEPSGLGQLSARTLTTNGDGRATASFQAPAPLLPPSDAIVEVGIVATAFGSNAMVENSSRALVRLVPTGVITPIGPSAQFTFTPAAPGVGTNVTFNGTASCAGPLDGSGSCPASAGAIVSYNWDFDDGTTASGSIVSHAFAGPGAFGVRLTVTSASGTSSSTERLVLVAAPDAPTASFTVSPTSPLVGQAVTLNASASRAAAGRTISSFSWNFGDGSPVDNSGSVVSHTFTAAGTYVVTLTVTDDLGTPRVVTSNVSVGLGNPTAAFIFSVINAATHTIQVDASGSTAAGGATITNYAWLWGDGNSDSVGAPVTTHSYAGAGTVTVRLTVTDSAGRTGTTTVNVAVP
jgi:PKD repeat protein